MSTKVQCYILVPHNDPETKFICPIHYLKLNPGLKAFIENCSLENNNEITIPCDCQLIKMILEYSGLFFKNNPDMIYDSITIQDPVPRILNTDLDISEVFAKNIPEWELEFVKPFEDDNVILAKLTSIIVEVLFVNKYLIQLIERVLARKIVNSIMNKQSEDIFTTLCDIFYAPGQKINESDINNENNMKKLQEICPWY